MFQWLCERTKVNGSECDFWVDKFADGELKCNVKRGNYVNSTTERSLRWLLIKTCINYPLKIPTLDDDFVKKYPLLWLCLSMWYWELFAGSWVLALLSVWSSIRSRARLMIGWLLWTRFPRKQLNLKRCNLLNSHQQRNLSVLF